VSSFVEISPKEPLGPLGRQGARSQMAILVQEEIGWYPPVRAFLRFFRKAEWNLIFPEAISQIWRACIFLRERSRAL